MDPGKRALLQAAMASMTEDLVGAIKQHMGTLVRDAPPDDKCAALDALLDYLEDLDLARDFLTVGGGAALTQCAWSTCCRLPSHGSQACFRTTRRCGCGQRTRSQQ